MARRFGRNQKRRLVEQVNTVVAHAERAQRQADRAERELATALRDQLSKGTVPLEVEHFLSREGRGIVMHAIFDERRANLHYQHEVSDRELQLQRDSAERERLGQYLGRAIADRLAEAYAGRNEGRSRS